MVQKPSVIRHSELLHCLVLDRSTTDDRGRIELVWMYPQVHRVLGFICRSGLMNPQRLAFTLPQIQAIRDKNIWVEGEPTAADSTQLNQLETLLYHEVWSESGAFLGKVKDCLFELKTGKITQYLVVLKGWRSVLNELYPLAPTEVLSFGKKRLLVSDRAGEEIQKQRDRIQQALVELRQDYQSIKQEVLHFSQRAQTLTQETVEKTVQTLKDLGAQLSDGMSDGSDVGEQPLYDRSIPPNSGPDFTPEDLEDLENLEDSLDFPETDEVSSPSAKTDTASPLPPHRSDSRTSKDSSKLFEWVEQIKAESEQWTDETFVEDEFQEDKFTEGLEGETRGNDRSRPEVWDDWE